MNVYSYPNRVSGHERKQIERMLIQKSKQYGAEVTLLNGNYIRFRVKDVKGDFRRMLEGAQINLKRKSFYESTKLNARWIDMKDDINLFYYTIMVNTNPIVFTKMN